MPPRVNASADELATLFMNTPAPGPDADLGKVFQCADCGRKVEFPEILYRDGQCEQCRTVPV